MTPLAATAPTLTAPDVPYYQPLGNETQLFEPAWRHGMPVLVKGPTGCGKTRFVQYMAQRLGLPRYTVACPHDLRATDFVRLPLIGPTGTRCPDGPLNHRDAEGDPT